MMWLQRQIADLLDGGRDRGVVDLSFARWRGPRTVRLFCAALGCLHRREATVAIAGADARARRALELCEIAGLKRYPTLGPELQDIAA